MGHFSSKMSKEWPLQSMAIAMGTCWTNFCSQKLKRSILAIFGFNRTALHNRSYTLSHYQQQSWCRLDYYLWGADKSETIDALKDNIREVIGGIKLYTIDNVLKNWTNCVGYCMSSRGSHLNEIIFHNWPEGFKKNLF